MDCMDDHLLLKMKDTIRVNPTVSDEDVLKELKEIDISNLTPLDALNTLYRLQTELKNRWNG